MKASISLSNPLGFIPAHETSNDINILLLIIVSSRLSMHKLLPILQLDNLSDMRQLEMFFTDSTT
jgi:hypothetical protein